MCHTVPKLKSITLKRKKCGTQFMNVCFRLKNFIFLKTIVGVNYERYRFAKIQRQYLGRGNCNQKRLCEKKKLFSVKERVQ